LLAESSARSSIPVLSAPGGSGRSSLSRKIPAILVKSSFMQSVSPVQGPNPLRVGFFDRLTRPRACCRGRP